MDSQDSGIEEKLVPFVEGALAEADRREVMAALPGQPALNQEVRQLREAILLLRGQAAKGLTYQSPVEAAVEQVVDYALQGESWSRQASRQFQLQILESDGLAEEVAILRELEMDLQQRVEAGKAVPEMPAALRAAIAEAYGRPASEPSWKKSLAAALAWMAGLNLKVASAAVAGVVVVVGGLGLGRWAHQQKGQTTSPTGPVAAATSTASPAADGQVAVATPEPMAAPAGQVPLLKGKVLPEDLPRISRQLWQKQVSHSYRDGQVYVAQADFDRAWAALDFNEQAGAHRPIKTVPVPAGETPAPPGGGLIGILPDSLRGGKPSAATAPPPPPPAPVASPVAASAQPVSHGSGSAPVNAAPAVAIELPVAPEAGRSGGDAPDYRPQRAPEDVLPTYSHTSAAAKETRSAEPSLPKEASLPRPEPLPQRRDYFSAPAPASKPQRSVGTAAPSSGERLQPSQMVRPAPPPPPPKPTVAMTRGGEQEAEAPPPRAVTYAPKKKVESLPPAPPVREEAPAVQPLRHAAPPVTRRNRNEIAEANLKVEPQGVEDKLSDGKDQRKSADMEDDATPSGGARPSPVAPPRPAPVSVVAAVPPAPPPAPASQVSANTGAVAQAQSVPPTPPPVAAVTMRGADEGMVTEKRSEDLAQQNRSTVALGRTTPPGALAAKREDAFEVPANAPFEVAMLPIAKKLVQDLVGEAKVQMERKEDGHLLVTVRPVRSLTPSEIDKLRKLLREKLDLKDEDTVVIRQP